MPTFLLLKVEPTVWPKVSDPIKPEKVKVVVAVVVFVLLLCCVCLLISCCSSFVVLGGDREPLGAWGAQVAVLPPVHCRNHRSERLTS